MFRFIRFISKMISWNKNVNGNVDNKADNTKFTLPQQFTGQIALQGLDTETEVYVYRCGRVIRQHTLPAKYCCRLVSLGSLGTRPSPV